MKNKHISRYRLTAACILSILLFACHPAGPGINLAEIDRDRIISTADKYLLEEPVTVIATQCERSHGGRHDFYSEGDYW